MARDTLRSVARKIKLRGPDPDPVWNAVDRLVLACAFHDREPEIGMIFAACKAILGEIDGPDRLFHVVTNLAADYAPEAPEGPPTFSEN